MKAATMFAQVALLAVSACGGAPVASAGDDSGTIGQFTVSFPVPGDTAGSATVRASGDGLTAEAEVRVRLTG